MATERATIVDGNGRKVGRGQVTYERSTDRDAHGRRVGRHVWDGQTVVHLGGSTYRVYPKRDT